MFTVSYPKGKTSSEGAAKQKFISFPVSKPIYRHGAKVYS